MKKLAVFLMMASSVYAVDAKLFKAIRTVESGGNANAVGDGVVEDGIHQTSPILNYFWVREAVDETK